MRMKSVWKFLDHTHLIETTPIFVAVSVDAMTINVVMVVLWCVLQSQGMEEKADMEWVIQASLSKRGSLELPTWVLLCRTLCVAMCVCMFGYICPCHVIYHMVGNVHGLLIFVIFVVHLAVTKISIHKK